MKRYNHTFIKASGSREMVEHERGEWVRVEDAVDALSMAVCEALEPGDPEGIGTRLVEAMNAAAGE